MQAPELVLKTMPPRQSKALVFRTHLSLLATEFEAKTIIEVRAPPGFGKTSLLAQWRREMLREGHRVAWLTIEAHDNNISFAEGLAFAMQQNSGHARFSESVAYHVHTSKNPLMGLTAWLSEVAKLGAETLLILDEMQLAPLSLIRESIPYLFLNAPANLRIVFATRRELSLEMSEMMAHGSYALLDIERLRLTQKETTEALTTRFGKQIHEEDCFRLHEKIAGWPLGLQLAVASLEKHAHPNVTLHTVSFAASDFDRYFQAFLDANFAPDVVAFLCQVSILELLSGEVCQAITGREDASKILHALKQELPVFSEGDAGQWMRIHPMARDFLRKQFQKLPADVQKSVHEKASNALAEKELLEAAASHALMAGLDDRAHSLMERSLYGELIRGNQMRVLYWLDKLPKKIWFSNQRTLITAAWALAESDRHSEAITLTQAILNNPNANEKERLEATLIQCAACFYDDKIDDLLLMLKPWRKYPADISSTALQAIYYNTLGTLTLYEGRPEQARQLVRDNNTKHPTDIFTIRLWGDWLVGMSYLWEGHSALAVNALSESIAKVEAIHGRRSAISVKLASSLAMAYWDTGQINKAAETIADRLDVLEKISSPESISLGYHVSARIAAAIGNETRAIDLLENLYALGKLRKIPRLCFTALYEQIFFHVSKGNSATCQHLLEQLEEEEKNWGLPEESLLRRLVHLRIAMAKAVLAMSERHWQGIIEHLAIPLQCSIRLQRGKEGMDIRWLLALAKKKQGLEEESAGLIHEAKNLSQVMGYTNHIQNRYPQWFDKIAAPSPIINNAPNNPPFKMETFEAQHTGLLTAKEHEILILLVKNMSNKQIAQVMNVSAETVKWHIKNLFAKLNAGSRKHVVDRAKMLGILW